MESTSIIMPVLNNCYFTKEFFKTFYKTTNEDYEFIIINNGSTDETVTFINELAGKDHRIIIKHLDSNIGVAAAWNLGIKEAKYNYYCIVNNDIEFLSSSWLTALQKTLQRTNIYWTSPRTCYNKDKPTFRVCHFEQLMYGTSNTQYIVGCCFMLPKKCIEEIGLFDESFSIKYYEDLDYINRILQAGKSVNMAPEALVYHYRGATSTITPGGETNELYYKEKWGNSPYNILSKQPKKVQGIKHFNFSGGH